MKTDAAIVHVSQIAEVPSAKHAREQLTKAIKDSGLRS